MTRSSSAGTSSPEKGGPPVPPSQTHGARRHFIPPTLERLILQCLAKIPEDRPQTMDEVRGRLRAIGLEYVELSLAVDRALGEDEPQPAPAPSVVIRPRKPAEAAPQLIDERALALGDTVLI